MLVATYPPFVRDSEALRQAVVWAEGLHADQRRDADRAPFILHPLEVASLLWARGYDEEVVVAGILHDLIEDTGALAEDVRERFGDRVTEIVLAVTEDPTIARFAERKAALRAQVARGGPDVIAVYAADKVAKARELRSQANRQHGQARRSPLPPPPRALRAEPDDAARRRARASVRGPTRVRVVGAARAAARRLSAAARHRHVNDLS